MGKGRNLQKKIMYIDVHLFDFGTLALTCPSLLLNKFDIFVSSLVVTIVIAPKLYLYSYIYKMYLYGRHKFKNDR